MKPTTKQIIDGTSWVLDNRVAPEATEAWAASSLRSVRGLLQHLSVRVEREGPLLTEDNADMRALLSEAAARLADGGEAWRKLAPDARAALVREWRDPAAYPTIASLDEENEALSSLLERLIHALHADGLDDPRRSETHEAVRAYLARQSERERPLYAPAFTGPPF